MHIIYDIKNKIASELAGFGFWQLKLTAQPVNRSTAQNDFANFRPGWWQFYWITGVKFNSIQSIIVWLSHITQFTVCATKNLTVFVADSPRCLEWSSIAAVSRALRELSTPRIFFIEIQRQGIILAPMCLCEGKMWKSNVKNIFHTTFFISHVGLSTGQQAKTRGTLARGVSLIAQSLTTHASTQPAVGAAKHHSQNAYVTAMFGQYIGGYFNN